MDRLYSQVDIIEEKTIDFFKRRFEEIGWNAVLRDRETENEW